MCSSEGPQTSVCQYVFQLEWGNLDATKKTSFILLLKEKHKLIAVTSKIVFYITWLRVTANK